MSGRALPTRAKRKPSEPLYLEVRRLVDPETGEEIGAFVPKTLRCRELMRTRKYRTGEIIRGDLHRVRNLKHHRLFMAICRFVIDNTERFPTIDALRKWTMIRLGRCDVYIDLTGETYYTPESINFDDMDQAEFDVFFRQACEVFAFEFWPKMTAEQVAEMARMYEGENES